MNCLQSFCHFLSLMWPFLPGPSRFYLHLLCSAIPSPWDFLWKILYFLDQRLHISISPEKCVAIISVNTVHFQFCSLPNLHMEIPLQSCVSYTFLLRIYFCKGHFLIHCTYSYRTLSLWLTMPSSRTPGVLPLLACHGGGSLSFLSVPHLLF